MDTPPTDLFDLASFLVKFRRLDPKHCRVNLKREFPDIFLLVEKSEGETFREKYFRLAHPNAQMHCLVCNQQTKFVSYKKGFLKFCSNEQCKQTVVLEAKKKTSLERYGTEFPYQSELVQAKVRATNLKKYGTEYPLQAEAIKQKANATKIEKYGCTMPVNDNYRKKNRRSKI